MTESRTHSRPAPAAASLLPIVGEPAPASEFEALSFGRALVHWFMREQRDLPWRRPRNARDPYRIIVSEFMLQQTTVAAVVPYYRRFLDRFPTLQSLAAAPLEDVLPLWAGLGYYSRARNLHALAQAVVQHHHGRFPGDLAAIRALPGVGRYTAGAVASIVFDTPAPIVDANVARVFARLFLIEGDIKTSANQSRLWREAERLVASCAGEVAPSALNPALMELGALVCTPRAPLCPRCPVAAFCAARAAGRQSELPQIKPKKPPIALRDACVFITSEKSSDESAPPGGVMFQKVLLRRRPDEAGTWWRGMWELPRVTAAENESTAEAAARLLSTCFGCESERFVIGPRLRTITHGVTRHRITLDCYAAYLDPEAPCPATEQAAAAWMTWDETDALALPSSMRSLLRWLRKESAGRESAGCESAQPALW